jgi:hypothetical protein
MDSGKNSKEGRNALIVIAVALFGQFCGLPWTAQAQQNPVPLINQPLVPDATAPGGGDFLLTLNGTGFASGAVVNWNGNALATTLVDSSQLTATVPAADIATATTGWITAVNPDSEGTSNLMFFPVTHPTASVFMGRTDFATLSGPEGVAVGDFNRDGILDLAIADVGSGSVSVLLGNGDGTFRAHVDYPVQGSPSSVVARDLNGDGILDLAVRDQSSFVSILLGNGDGTFQAATNFPAGNGVARMAAGDFNGDGNLDLATTAGSDAAVSILLGNGDGTFQPYVNYAVGSGPYGIAVGDVNGDGDLDLVVADSGFNAYAVLLGNGDGTFQPYVRHGTVADPQSVVLADFNGDGKLDLAVFGEGESPATAIYLGNGDGTFKSRAEYTTGCGSDGTDCTAAAADLNGDGRLDLVVRNNSNGSDMVAVFLGKGDGTFQNPIFFGTGSEPEQVTVGDFNGDGRLDLAVADLGASAVSVLIQLPVVGLSPSTVNFGNQPVGTTTQAQTVTLTNNGTRSVIINGVHFVGADAGDFAQTNACGASVAAGASCTFSVTFTPKTTGSRTATMGVADSAADSPQTVALSGTGT